MNNGCTLCWGMKLVRIYDLAMKAVARTGVLVALAVTPSHAAHATEQLVVRHYQSADGLPVSSATSGHVDSNGFLWLATHDGLVRFDGKAFKVYNTFNSPAIRNNRIVDIYRGKTGRSYALTADGDLLHLDVGGVRRIGLGTGAPASIVRAVYEEPFCVTTAQGLFCEEENGDFSLRLPFETGLEAAAAFPVAEDQFWLLIPDKGIVLQTGRERRLLFDDAHAYTTPVLLPKAKVGRDGRLTVTWKGGLLQIERDGESRWVMSNAEEPIHVVQLRQDRDGTLWVGTDRGIYHVDHQVLRLFRGLNDERDPVPSQSWRAPDGALWECLGGRLFREGVLVLDSDGMVNDVSFDAAGTAWVSTLRDGVYALSRPRVETFGVADGLFADNVYTVARDTKGTMWLGSLNGPVQAVGAGGDIRRYGLESGLPGLNPWAVTVAPDDAIYVGTYSPGLFRKEEGGNRFEKVRLPGPLSRARILALSFDRAGRFWLGTTKGVWRREGASWRRVWPENEDVGVHAILHDVDGGVWFGAVSGLWRRRNGVVEAVAADVIEGVAVRGLLQDRGGAIWASTEGYGLVRINTSASADMTVARLGRAEGLPSDSPHSVLEDDDGNLWVNSNQGVFRVAKENLQDWISGSAPTITPLILGLSDGVTELEGNGGLQPAAAFDVQGRMWFPYQRGVIRIDPDRFSWTRKAPVPVIDGLEAGGTTFAAGTVSLPVGTRSVSIHYSASDLHDGRAVRFRYRIFPDDGRWVDVGGQRAVSLASMPPGDYLFELIAANGDGAWSTAPATLAFTVPARWYETAYFRLSIAACLVGLIFLMAQQRVRGARRRAEDLGRQVEARTRELRIGKRQVEDALMKLSESHRVIEEKNLRLADQASRLEKINNFRARLFADVSHELRTPLMLASMPLKEIGRKALNLPQADHRRLALSISQMDRLTLLVQQMLCLAQAEAGQLKLSITSFDVCQLLKEIVDGFRVLNEKSALRYEIHDDAVFLPIFADRDRLTTVLDNLLDNASQYAPPGSVVDARLSVDAAAEMVRIVVSDSGPGFSPALAKNLFRRFFKGEASPRAGRDGLGIGLATARELVELHGGEIGASSRPGEGASFWITLPLGSAHVSLDELDPGPTQVAVPMRAANGGSARARKVLIVEDHSELANYLGHRLGEYCPVQVVADAEQALGWLAQEAFGMVVADVVLPGMSGIALCRDIKADQRLADLPVLLMSARAESARSEEGLNAGAEAYLVKPFSFEALLNAISRAWPDASLYFRSDDRIVSEAGMSPLLSPALNALSDPDFSVGSWARQSYLSERQLRRRVIELTGQSPVAWLREQRLLRVRKLISDGTCRALSEAGAKVGLDNPGYLYRIYRARFGVAED
ncbi:ATP-binding protein [Luteimonas salinilitoris]|uniref:histidine kinase n=1 Tax=Luteimonas salinilitoris TaxID=3237697 RepID=A0ABV4HPF0_9GAMM